MLACVPLDDPVPFKDVADICGISVSQLCRVTRLMATAGFLQEPRPGQIAHSPLSAGFVTEPALLDAAMFLSGTAAPTSLKMPLATKQFAASGRADQSAYAAAFDTNISLATVFERQPRLQRQFDTYFSCITGDDQTGIRKVLMQVDWGSLGDATVVDVSYYPAQHLTTPLTPEPRPPSRTYDPPPETSNTNNQPDHQSQVGPPSASTAINLASLFPSLHFIVQTYKPSPTGPPCLTPPTANTPAAEIPTNLTSQITLQQRTRGTTQFARPAAVYLLHLPSPSPSLSWPAISTHAVSELSAHVDVLRTNPGARLVLTALVLPPPATPTHGTQATDAEVEAAARVRDLTLLQLANGRHAELAEVVALLNGVRDGAGGGFVVTDEIRVSGSAVVAWEVRYRGGV